MNTHNSLFSVDGSSVVEILVSGFLDHDLFKLYESDPDDPQIAYDLIATWGRIKRCKLEIVEKYLGDAARQLEEIVISDMERLLEMAVGVPDASAWLQYAETVTTASENLMFPDPDVESHIYCDLLEQLDDAELVSWAVSQLEKDLPIPDLGSCFDHIQKHIEKFVTAAGWVHGMNYSMRTDLLEYDPELALTLEKFNWILEEFEVAKSELSADELAEIEINELVDDSNASPEEKWHLKVMTSIKEKLALLPKHIRSRVLIKPVLPESPEILAAASTPKIPETIPLAWEGVDGGWEAIAEYDPSNSGNLLTIWIKTDLLFENAIIGKKRIPLQRQGSYFIFHVNLRQSLEDIEADIPVLVLETIDGDVSIGMMTD